MTDYDNTNRGSLFKNDLREKDTHPEYSGTLNIEGREYWLSAWVKDGRKGKFFSLSVKPKDEDKPAKASRRGVPAADPAFPDDDIPF